MYRTIVSLAFVIVLTMLLMGQAVYAQDDSNVLSNLVDRFFSKSGQEQFLVGSAINVGTGVASGAINNKLNLIINAPDDWCIEGTDLWNHRTNDYYISQSIGIAYNIFHGLKNGIDGDWGLAILFGGGGAMVGSSLPCAVGNLTSSPILKSFLIAIAPPIMSSIGAFFGYYSHVGLQEDLRQVKESD